MSNRESQLSDAVRALLRQLERIGGYSTHEDQAEIRCARRLLVEAGGTWQSNPETECRVCHERANQDGERWHGKGCYALSADGGGVDFP